MGCRVEMRIISAKRADFSSHFLMKMKKKCTTDFTDNTDRNENTGIFSSVSSVKSVVNFCGDLGVAVTPDHLAPARRNGGALLVGELVLVRLVTLDACQVLAQPRHIRLEARELEVVVDLFHFA